MSQVRLDSPRVLCRNRYNIHAAKLNVQCSGKSLEAGKDVRTIRIRFHREDDRSAPPFGRTHLPMQRKDLGAPLEHCDPVLMIYQDRLHSRHWNAVKHAFDVSEPDPIVSGG